MARAVRRLANLRGRRSAPYRWGSDYYAPQQLAGAYHLTQVVLVGYAYPPASVPLFLPLETYPLGLAMWITLNLGLLLTSLWTLLSRATPSHRMFAFALVLIALSVFPPFYRRHDFDERQYWVGRSDRLGSRWYGWSIRWNRRIGGSDPQGLPWGARPSDP